MPTHVSHFPHLRPLLKWAGGKRQLLPTIGLHYPTTFTRYIEPFFGSGAVFFDLYSQGRLADVDVRLADVNVDLVGCYETVRARTGAVVAELEKLAAEYRDAEYQGQGGAFYYEVRDRRFNTRRADLAATRARHPGRRRVRHGYTPALAAMLIFLNRTGFNGLFRLNRDGGFNVPVGRYSDPRICDRDHVRAVAAAFADPRVTLTLSPFEQTLADAGPGDFVYCDPPYAPLSRTSSFANYTADGFSSEDQARLQRAVIAACGRGARVVLSNSSAPEILSLYSDAASREAGLHVHLVPARRAINARAASRGPVNEVLVSNVVGQKLRMAKSRLAPATRRVRSA